MQIFDFLDFDFKLILFIPLSPFQPLSKFQSVLNGKVVGRMGLEPTTSCA